MYQKIKSLMSLVTKKIINNVDKENFKEDLRKGILEIGPYSYGFPKIMKYKGNESYKVIIGKYCSIANNVTIFTGGNHEGSWISTYPFRIMFNLEKAYLDGQPSSKGNVIIGNDVWIGEGATILSGIEIGNGAIIAANSVVVKNVEPYSIVGGNPAKKIRYRFSENQIKSLLNIEWWNWSEEKIISNVHYLSSNEYLDEFIKKNSVKSNIGD